MPAEILSLDLDWFNHLRKDRLQTGIFKFFDTLSNECTFPKRIDLMPEHQYLYPWCVRLLEKRPYRKINMINVDQHHDFYSLSEIEDIHCQKVGLDDSEATVGCWNFFAFMVQRKMLGRYTWITSQRKEHRIEREEADLLEAIRDCKSLTVRRFREKINVGGVGQVSDLVRGKKFDGFVIVRSPLYTKNFRSVYHILDKALERFFPRTQVRRYRCRVNFKNGLVYRRAQSLF